MPYHPVAFPVGASALQLVKRERSYPFLLGTDSFNRVGEDGSIPVIPLFGGDERVGTVLEGHWHKGWDANMDADQSFTAILDGSGILEFEGEADVAGTGGYGWINSHHPLPLMNEVEVTLTMSVPVDDTGGVAARDIEFNFYLRKEKKAVDVPNGDTDFIKWGISVDEDGLLLELEKEINTVNSTLFDGSTYDDTSARATGALEGMVIRFVFHDGHFGEASPEDVRHMHIFLNQSNTINNAELAPENELSSSPYDISDLLFDVAYPAFEIYSENATIFDSGNEAKSTYVRVDYPDFDVRYDPTTTGRLLNEVELWDGDPSSGGVKVRDVDHVFSNDPYLQNGLIQLQVDEGVQYGLNARWYGGAAWNLSFRRIYPRLLTDGQDVDYPWLLNVIYVSPEKVVLEVKHTDTGTKDDDYFFTQQITLRRGDYSLEFKVVEIYPMQEVQIGLTNTGGSTYRFTYVGDGVIIDDDFPTSVNNNTPSDNFMLIFDDTLDAVVGSLSFDNRDVFRASDGIFYYRYLGAIGEKYWFNHSPFSLIANLFKEAEDGSYGAAGTVADAGASGGTAVQLNAIGNFQTPAGEYSAYVFTAGTHLPAGRYLAIIRAVYIDEETMEMYVWNDDDDEYRNEENAKVTKTLTSDYAFYSLVFDITDADVSGTDSFAIVAEKSTDDADEIRVDDMLVVPIGDGESFPQDLSHSALRDITRARRLFNR